MLCGKSAETDARHPERQVHKVATIPLREKILECCRGMWARLVPIMLLKLPIMLWSNPHYAPIMLNEFDIYIITFSYLILITCLLTSSIFLVPPECKISSTKELFT